MDGAVSVPDAHAHDPLEAQIAETWAQISAATYRFLTLVAEFDRGAGWARYGLANCAQWLNWRCGISGVAAREKLRVAHALERLPKISDAFRLGELSYSKVRALTRVATPANENVLLDAALRATAVQVERLVRSFRSVERIDEALEADARHRDRYLHYRHEDDGTLVLHARLPAEVGAIVVKAIEAAIEPTTQPPGTEADTLHQEVSVTGGAGETGETGNMELIDPAGTHGLYGQPEAAVPAGTPSDVDGSKAGSDEISQRPIGLRRADALRRVCERFLDAETDRVPASADRYQIVVHVDHESLLRVESPTHIDAPRQRCEIENGPTLAAETVRRLACESAIVRILENSAGDVLDVGRKTRTIPPSLRRALQARDGGCRFPGCDHTRFTEGHHVRHWADGGETKLPNLVTLCRYHHRLIHEGGFSVEATEGGRFVFSDPDGRSLAESACSRGNGLLSQSVLDDGRCAIEGLAWRRDTVSLTSVA